MNANNNPSTIDANHIRELVSRLRYELQQYYDNDIKGGVERRRNMVLLRWDIRKLELQLKAIKADDATAVLDTFNLNRDKKFRYMMLSRLQSDCKYYLGCGNRNARHSLWACDEAIQIALMRALWYSLPVTPEWLTLEQIDEYAKQMNVI